MGKRDEIIKHLNRQEAPEEIHNVSQGYFSVARYYGGCEAYGTQYVYIIPDDKLVRIDLIKNYKKKNYAKVDRKKEFQPDMFTEALGEGE